MNLTLQTYYAQYICKVKLALFYQKRKKQKEGGREKLCLVFILEYA